MIDETPIISVVIPACNEEGSFPLTLRSLLAQDYRGSYEIIVVNNNSTDHTAHTAQESGVHVISEPRPGTLPGYYLFGTTSVV
jgi:glycosyltransferase involved in cell wall biosynthesis